MEAAPAGPPPTPRSAAPAGPPVSIRGLVVRAGGRVILDGADADFPSGQLTLIAGASGAGKSILLRTLAGLLRPGTPGFQVQGSIRIGDRELLAGRSGRGPSPAGIVFQSFALFDELSSEENIRFGHDHRRGEGRTDRSLADGASLPRQLMEELGIPHGPRVSVLSGGQKQRLAIARALAFDPELIAYDEPTSGLDPRTAERVVEMILTTGRVHGKTTIVVTHDWPHFEAVAARTYLLEDGKLRDTPAGGLGRWKAGSAAEVDPALETAAVPESSGLFRPPPGQRSPVARAAAYLGWLMTSALAATGSAVEAALQAAAGLLPLWRSARWGLRYLVHYLWLVASPSAWLYFGAAGAIAGFVSTHFTFKFLPFRAYTEPLLTEELLHALGFALYRILVPVLITVLIAARCGAAAASDVGTRRYTLAIDAMNSMGARPSRYLLTNILYAFAIGAPFLVALAFTTARMVSLLVFSYDYPQHGPFFWDSHFHRSLRVPGAALYDGTGWLLAKVVLCGLGIGTVAYHRGMKPKHSGQDVSAGITSTIIWSTLFVLVVHFAFAFFEY
jgi:ABC-type multidrug transport system ATPase subunit/ABC-type transporter Mla maintaining outer membrane lipid asymmetry permease subunit MlaE